MSKQTCNTRDIKKNSLGRKNMKPGRNLDILKKRMNPGYKINEGKHKIHFFLTFNASNRWLCLKQK